MSYFYKENVNEHKPSRKQMHYREGPHDAPEDVRDKAKQQATQSMVGPKGGYNPFVQHKHDRLDDFGFHALHPSQQRDVPPASQAVLSLAPPSAIIPPRDNGNVIAPEPQDWDEAKPKRRGAQPISDEYLQSICPPKEAPRKTNAIAQMESANGEGQQHFSNRFTNDPPTRFGQKMVTPIGVKEEGVGIWGFNQIGKMSEKDTRLARAKKGGGMVTGVGKGGEVEYYHHSDTRRSMGSVLTHSQQEQLLKQHGGGDDMYDAHDGGHYDEGGDGHHAYDDYEGVVRGGGGGRGPIGSPISSRSQPAPPVPQGGRPKAHHLPPMGGGGGGGPANPRSNSSMPWTGGSPGSQSSDPFGKFEQNQQFQPQQQQQRRPRETSFNNVGMVRKTGPERFEHQRQNPRRNDKEFAEFRKERTRESGVWSAMDHTVHTKDPYSGVGQSKPRGRGGPPEVANSRGVINAHHAGNFALAPSSVHFPSRAEGTTMGSTYRAHTSMN